MGSQSMESRSVRDQSELADPWRPIRVGRSEFAAAWELGYGDRSARANPRVPIRLGLAKGADPSVSIRVSQSKRGPVRGSRAEGADPRGAEWKRTDPRSRVEGAEQERADPGGRGPFPTKRSGRCGSERADP